MKDAIESRKKIAISGYFLYFHLRKKAAILKLPKNRKHEIDLQKIFSGG